jgi:hypothetical protein
MKFKNIKQVDEHYKYPMSHRMGSIYDNKGIIRIYSNGLSNDFSTKNYFYYRIKNEKIKNLFLLTKKNNKKLRIIVKKKDGVEDLGLARVMGLYKNFVRLKIL